MNSSKKLNLAFIALLVIFACNTSYSFTLELKNKQSGLSKVAPLDFTIPKPSLCSFKLYAYYKIWCQSAVFYPAIAVPFGWSGYFQSYSWDFGDGNTSNLPYATHVYASGGTYTVSLTVLAVDKKGNCCTRKYYFTINVKSCKPCELIKVNTIVTTNYGSLIKYEPSIAHSSSYAYEWTFSDGTSYSTREVYKTSFLYWAQLTIWYTGNIKECCRYTTKRFFYYYNTSRSLSLDSSKAVETLSDNKNLVYDDKLSEDEIQSKISKFAKDNDLKLDGDFELADLREN